MWKIFEDLKKDAEEVKDDILDKKTDDAKKKEIEQEALNKGSEALQGHEIVALQDGVVEMINQNSNEVEIYFDNGSGMGIRFPFGAADMKVLVSANEKVKKGQPLVTFGPGADPQAKIYAFTPDMIQVLSNSRFRID